MANLAMVTFASSHLEGDQLRSALMLDHIRQNRRLRNRRRAHGDLALVVDQQDSFERVSLARRHIETFDLQHVSRSDPILFAACFQYCVHSFLCKRREITTKAQEGVNASFCIFRGNNRVGKDDKAKAKGQPVFSVTIADFYNAPVVSEIDLSGYTGRSGEAIRIVATDDFEVASVGVRITNTNNAVVEEGPAARDGQNGSDWTYQSRTALPAGETVSIEVTATDRPGNKNVKTQPRS